MRLEDVQLAIRPRSLLECLDLTFLYCGQHWLELSLTAAVGILPIASFNWWIVDIKQLNGYAAYLLLAMEMPWATMLITLYLGQATFSQKLSSGRMLRDGFRAIPGLVAFQTVIRGLCLLIVVL